LVDKKLVKREENVLDRRSVNIKLTPNTEKQFNEFRKGYLINAGKSFINLNETELKQFIKLLDKLKIENIFPFKKNSD